MPKAICTTVRVYNPVRGNNLIINCLLDSGADKCLFPEFIATSVLSMRSGGKSQSKGIANFPIDTYPHLLRLELLSTDYNRVIWASKNLTIDCVPHDVPPLLGSSDFLINFIISFNYKQEFFTIKHKKELCISFDIKLRQMYRLVLGQ